MIEFVSEDRNYTELLIDKEKTIVWIIDAITSENFIAGDITFIHSSDEYLLTINKQYLNHDYYTDVITFDYSEDKIISGDIFVSVERITDNASEYNVNLHDEYLRVIIHGVLHLCGYKDATDEERKSMRNKEDYYLNRF